MQTDGGDGPGARQSAGEWDDPWRPGPQTPPHVDPEPSPEGVIYPASQAHVTSVREAWEVAREWVLLAETDPDGAQSQLIRFAAYVHFTPLNRLVGAVSLGVGLLSGLEMRLAEAGGALVVAEWVMGPDDPGGIHLTDGVRWLIPAMRTHLLAPEVADALGEAGDDQLRLGLAAIEAAFARDVVALSGLLHPSLDPDFAVDAVLNAVHAMAGMLSEVFPDDPLTVEQVLLAAKYPESIIDVAEAIRVGACAGQPVLLTAYAARSCPRKTHNTFERALGPVPQLRPPTEWAYRFEQGNVFEAGVFHAFVDALGSRCVDLTPSTPISMPEHVRATLAAMTAGVEVILGGWLPDDLDGGRSGKPDVLLRGNDRADGGPGYHAADVKAHQATSESRTVSPGSVLVSWPEAPSYADAATLTGWTAKAGMEPDWLQLGHYHRMLDAAGFGVPGPPVAALIGTGVVDGRSNAIVWLDLATPRITGYSRARGTAKRSILAEYDFQFAFRQEIAHRAVLMGADDTLAPLVEPIMQHECTHCRWREVCPLQLPPDDAALLLPPGSGATQREWALLRAAGVRSLLQMATLDLEGPLVNEVLAQVATPHSVKARIAGYRRKADMLVRGVRIERTTTGPLDLPRSDVEVDFDIEWIGAHDVYLYGLLVTDGDSAPTYEAVSSFGPATADSVRELAERAVQRLIALRAAASAQGRSFAVFHYSNPEISQVRTVLGQPHAGFEDLVTTTFHDLHTTAKAHYQGVWGLGLKEIAVYGAGFHWDDVDPGGLNSQTWAAAAMAGDDDARQRVLKYNEDDVRATATLRAWMRADSK